MQRQTVLKLGKVTEMPGFYMAIANVCPKSYVDRTYPANASELFSRNASAT